MKRLKPVISFHFQAVCTLRNRLRLRSKIISVFKEYDLPALSVNIIFCDDDFLLEINKAYLKHDYYTDIITFNLAEPNAPIQGEIYISVDRIKDNAADSGVSFENELHRVIFHGVLHLCGLDDSTPRNKAEMTGLENKLLNQYFVSRET